MGNEGSSLGTQLEPFCPPFLVLYCVCVLERSNNVWKRSEVLGFFFLSLFLFERERKWRSEIERERGYDECVCVCVCERRGEGFER